MKKLMVLAIAGFLGLAVSAPIASAKAPWKKQLGAADCKVCHDDKGKKDPNPDNANWKKSKEMVEKMAKGEGDFAGKASCEDCHKGKMKP